VTTLRVAAAPAPARGGGGGSCFSLGNLNLLPTDVRVG